ncbi:MAG: bacterial Ig-like domain-containing protein [Treponema sp.]|nr:bacterial Ig-like domain-containing protein [Treponema sp.]
MADKMEPQNLLTNPVFNLKTGADSDIIVSREETSGANKGKITLRQGFYRSPWLARRTGDSIQGQTESIESNELRHGRTDSAPRKGTSSASGDLEIEFSPESFDDLLAGVLRGKWLPWKNDTNSPSNKDKNAFADGYIATKCAKKDHGKKLLYASTDPTDPEYADDVGLINVKDPTKVVVHELNCGTEDIKYSFLKKFGGVTGEDLYQEFTHVSMNTLSLQVQINAIVTGSFGVVGLNNPKVFNDDAISADNKENIYTALADRFANVDKSQGAAYAEDTFFPSIPEKACDTDQFTARQGFMTINGTRVQYATNLSLSLDNGLDPKYAIFEPNAISVPPLKLTINGDLTTYLVKDGSDKLFNQAVADETIELLFVVQDLLEDPTALYLFQIFNAKFTENTVSGNGEDTMDVSLPWKSFGEQALRILRIVTPRVVGGVLGGNDVKLLPNVDLNGTDFDLSGMEFSATLDGQDYTAEAAFGTPVLVSAEGDDYGMISVPMTVPVATTTEQILGVKVEWNDKEYSKSFSIVLPTLESIEITSEPTKTTYEVGDDFDSAGMVVTASYRDGTSKSVDGWTTTGFDSSEANPALPITVSYTEGSVTKTATFNVEIVSI